MHTFKFEGLTPQDSETAYFYGSLPAKPERGHILVFDKTGNRYVIYLMNGQGLTEGKARDNERELAFADISRGESVPTIWLQKIEDTQVKASGTSFVYEELKASSQQNREKRLSAAT
jgi:hypothetical protein